MKGLFKYLGQIPCAKVPQCLSWNQGSLAHLLGENVPQSLHLPFQTKTFLPSKSKVFDRRQANILARVRNL